MLKFWKKKTETTETDADSEAVAENPDQSAHETRQAPQPRPEPPEPKIDEVADDTPDARTDAPRNDLKNSASSEPQAPPDANAAKPPGWRERLSGSGFARGLGGLFKRHPQLDDALLDELETVLITADVGVTASTELVDDLRQRTRKREFADAAALQDALRQALIAQLQPVMQPLDVDTHAPFVLLVVGVNGVGKTTTIGKLAHRYRGQGKNLILAAGDTFRAAAVEQLKTWGERNRVPVIAQSQGSDSASVIFDALQGARARQADLLIADTAGRLHTQGGLMDELGKIARVLKKIDPDAPHEVLMVIDGTTGQNAISQVRQFHQSIGVTGLVVTKLDGTAKGGVVFALAREFGLPIRYVGLGEGIADMRPFDAGAYVEGLLPSQPGS